MSGGLLLDTGLLVAVRLSELHCGAMTFTLDSDFRIYRRHGNKTIPLLMPED